MPLLNTDISSLFDQVEQHKRSERVRSFCARFPHFEALLSSLSLSCQAPLFSLLSLGQEHLFIPVAADPTLIASFRPLLEQLILLETQLKPLGGIEGYQQKIMQLLRGEPSLCELIPPEGVDFTKSSPEREAAIESGISNAYRMAEFYPIGGAADRLNYYDSKRGKKLPAAPFEFLGKSLLEGIIADLQAREFLYYQKTGLSLETPLVLMTSDEKENHELIKEILEEKKYFGRNPESIRLIKQPSIPCVDRKGRWVLKRPFELLLRPGGHGAIWQAAKEEGIFSWLKEQGRDCALIRQINNPIAGIDCGLLALSGYGHLHGKAFGFASCERLVHASEGMNVIKKKEGMLAISNIEYCQFADFGIVDQPKSPLSPYSHFPSNTNILFCRLSEVEQAIERVPYPGLILNFKKETYFDGEIEQEGEVARLEAMMQNIADELVDSTPDLKGLKTFITFNERKKTISAIKKQGEALSETARGCFFDYLSSAVDLLSSCGVSAPSLSLSAYRENRPELLFTYHPALGPLYSLIQQKIRGGVIHPGSELHLDIADLHLEHLNLEGSLIIETEAVMGHRTSDHRLCFSSQQARCTLRHVRVMNAGVDWEEKHTLWNRSIQRKELLRIHLGEGSAFIAEDIVFQGAREILVPPGKTMIAEQKEKEVTFHLIH